MKAVADEFELDYGTLSVELLEIRDVMIYRKT